MKKIVIFGALGILFAIVILLSFAKKQTPPSTLLQVPTPTGVLPAAVQFQSIDYSHIFTDPSVAKKMGEALQSPLSTGQEGDYLVGHFASDAATFSTDVYQQNRMAKFVVQMFVADNTYYSNFLLTHSTDDQKTLYDPSQSGSGFVWQVFPTDGVAFFTNSDDGFTGKVLYFAPTTYATFLQTAAKTLNLSSSDVGSQDTSVEKGE